jgi:thiamine biosynthesis lipoprotein
MSGQAIAKVNFRQLQRYAVATSTTRLRHGVKDGTAWHHIIDPQTAKPAETDLTTASVCTASLFEADVHATNCIILGRATATKYLHKQNITDAVLQPEVGEYTIIGKHIQPAVDKVKN